MVVYVFFRLVTRGSYVGFGSGSSIHLRVYLDPYSDVSQIYASTASSLNRPSHSLDLASFPLHQRLTLTSPLHCFRLFHDVLQSIGGFLFSRVTSSLAGCSVGGLTSILQCNNFRSQLPATTKVKCLSDVGFFINAKTIIGQSHIEGFYADVVRTHGSAKVLSPACLAKMSPGLVRSEPR
ncbi:hypothetical protein L1887_23879 [Cichorium endivia]|nr:hypothetical protein L1887_23879 [Cichorium endivia]